MNVFDTMAIEELIPLAIAVVVIFATLFSVLYIIWGGFLMIISWGVEEKVKKAVNHIRHAIIGVFFILIVLFVLPVLMDLAGIPYGEYMKPGVVFETMSDISAQIFGTSSESNSTLPLDNGSSTSEFSDL